MVHHSHKQPISQLFRCTPIILPDKDTGLNQIVAKNSNTILASTTEGDIFNYAFTLNQGESSNPRSTNGRIDEDASKAIGKLHVSTLDHIKDMEMDSDGKVIFSQLQSGVMISG